jgi:hypothetical protein
VAHKLQEVLLLALAVLPANHMRLNGPPLQQLLELPAQLGTDAVAGLLAAAIKVRASALQLVCLHLPRQQLVTLYICTVIRQV